MMRKLLAGLFMLLAAVLPASAQTTKAATIAQFSSTCLPNNVVGAITPATVIVCLTNMVNSYEQYASVNAQSGASYTILASDYGQLVTFNNSGSIAVSLPAASGSNFTTFSFYVRDIGAGTVTITPVSGTINGAGTFAFSQGQGAFIVSDGTNWQVWASSGNALPSGDIFVGNAAGLARPVALSGDCTLTNAGAISCPMTSGVTSLLGASSNILGSNFFAMVGQTLYTTTDPRAYGAKCDALSFASSGVSINAGSNVLTVAGGGFTLADATAAKVISVPTAGANAWQALNATITGYNSPTSVNLSANAGRSISLAESVLYGTDDTTALQTMFNSTLSGLQDFSGITSNGCIQTAALSLSQPKIIQGSGRAGAKLYLRQLSGADNFDQLDLLADSIAVRDIGLDYDDGGATVNNGTVIKYVGSHNLFDNIEINAHQTDPSSTGVNAIEAGDSINFSGVVVQNSHFFNFAGNGIGTESTNDAYILNNQFDHFQPNTHVIGIGPAVATSNLHIAGNKCDISEQAASVDINCVFVSGGGSYLLSDVFADQNRLIGPPGNTGAAGMFIADANNVHETNNYFQDWEEAIGSVDNHVTEFTGNIIKATASGPTYCGELGDFVSITVANNKCDAGNGYITSGFVYDTEGTNYTINQNGNTVVGTLNGCYETGAGAPGVFIGTGDYCSFLGGTNPNAGIIVSGASSLAQLTGEQITTSSTGMYGVSILGTPNIAVTGGIMKGVTDGVFTQTNGVNVTHATYGGTVFSGVSSALVFSTSGGGTFSDCTILNPAGSC